MKWDPVCMQRCIAQFLSFLPAVMSFCLGSLLCLLLQAIRQNQLQSSQSTICSWAGTKQSRGAAEGWVKREKKSLTKQANSPARVMGGSRTSRARICRAKLNAQLNPGPPRTGRKKRENQREFYLTHAEARAHFTVLWVHCMWWGSGWHIQYMKSKSLTTESVSQRNMKWKCPRNKKEPFY